MGLIPFRIAMVAAVCSCAFLLDPSHGTEEVTADRIAQMWAEREKRAKSCRVVWSETATYPKGSFYAAPLANPKDSPTTDLIIPATCKLTIGANKSRYEYQGQLWSTKTRKLEPSADIMTFDGTRSANTSLQSPLIGNPQVVLKKATVSPQSQLPLFLPIWLTARASIASKEIPINQYAPTGRKQKINNRLCYE